VKIVEYVNLELAPSVLMDLKRDKNNGNLKVYTDYMDNPPSILTKENR
jgi:hypothetical protein